MGTFSSLPYFGAVPPFSFFRQGAIMLGTAVIKGASI